MKTKRADPHPRPGPPLSLRVAATNAPSRPKERIAQGLGAEALRPTLSSARQDVPAMSAVHLVALPEEGLSVIRVAGREERAAIDPSVDAVVLASALARGERVIAQRDGDEWIVLGALRTRATPGLEPGDEYVISARRVTIEGVHDVTLRSGAASLAIRAYGFVETLAQDITTRAARAHKLVGRVLRLN